MTKVVYLLIVGVALPLGWFFGYRAGLNKSEISESKVYEAVILANAAANLRVFSEISEKIQAGRYAAAKCKADLSASSLFDEVNECLQNDSCRAQLSDIFQEQIPSVLANEKFIFKYYKNNEICEE